MQTLGPYVRYADPRIYALVAAYAWGPHQREMLLGTRPWPGAHPSVLRIVTCLRERGIRVGLTREGVAHVLMDGLPPHTPLLPALLKQWNIAVPRATVLSLEGPIEVVGGVPILRGAVFGCTERADGRRHHGLNTDAWIVGRGDVLLPRRRCDGVEPWWDPPGEAAVGGRAARGTFTRARNTARRVAAALPDWEAFLCWKARKDREAGQALLTGGATGEPEDEAVLRFAS